MKRCNDCSRSGFQYGLRAFICNKKHEQMSENGCNKCGNIYNMIYYLEDKGECPDFNPIIYDDPSGSWTVVKKCPKCGADSLDYDPDFKKWRCLWVGCFYEEDIDKNDFVLKFKEEFKTLTNDQKHELFKIVSNWEYSRPYHDVAEYYKDKYRVMIEDKVDIEASSEEEAIEKALKLVDKSCCVVCEITDKNTNKDDKKWK